MTRTAQQLFFLESPEMKRYFEKLVDVLTEIYHVEKHNLTLMDNHYHLTIKISKPKRMSMKDTQSRFERLQNLNKRKRNWVPMLAKKHFNRFTSLSWFMWDLNRRVSIFHNRRRGTKGHLWGGRYKKVPLEDDAAIMRAMAYIEQNPVRAGLTKKPSDYRYGLTGRLLNALKRGRIEKAPAVGFLKRFVGKKRMEAFINYMNYLSKLVQNPELRRKLPPVHIRKLFEDTNDVEEIHEIIKAVEQRTPAQFHRSIVKKE